MYNCPKCSTEFELGIKFCSKCGENLEQSFIINPVCPKCKKTYSDGTTFCSEDGVSLVSNDKMIPKCLVCNTIYSDDVKFCPKDGGEVIAEAFRKGKSGSTTPRKSNDLNKHPKEGYEVAISEYIKQGFELFKQNMGLFISFTLIYLVLQFISIAHPLLSLIMTLFVSPSLMAGFAIVSFKAIKNQKIVFSDFFKGLEYFLPLCLFTIVNIIFIIVGSLLILPGIYFGVCYIFSSYFIIDKKMSFWQAMESSKEIIKKEWFSIFGLLLCLALINILGAIAFGIGLFVTIPLSFCALALAYDDIVGIDSNEF